MVDGGCRPDGPCHGRAEELTREGTEGIGRCAIVLIMARCTSGQRNAPSTGMHVSCTNRDRPCSLCHNPVSTATKTSALPILSVKNINTQIPHARSRFSRFSRFSRTRTKNATGSTYKRDNRIFCKKAAITQLAMLARARTASGAQTKSRFDTGPGGIVTEG